MKTEEEEIANRWKYYRTRVVTTEKGSSEDKMLEVLEDDKRR